MSTGFERKVGHDNYTVGLQKGMVYLQLIQPVSEVQHHMQNIFGGTTKQQHLVAGQQMPMLEAVNLCTQCVAQTPESRCLPYW